MLRKIAKHGVDMLNSIGSIYGLMIVTIISNIGRKNEQNNTLTKWKKTMV